MNYTDTEALNLLVAEGNHDEDVRDVIDSLVGTGLQLPQPDQGWLFTEGELDTLRELLMY